jgi:hypothetical protein
MQAQTDVKLTPLLLYLREKKAMKAQKAVSVIDNVSASQLYKGRDRAERRKRSKEKKVKEKKPDNKDKQPPRKKEGRKKKKEDGKDEDKKKDDKMATNGVWMIRKNLEPGSIAILPKEKTTSEAPKQMIPSEPSVQVQSKKPPRVDNRQGRRAEVLIFWLMLTSEANESLCSKTTSRYTFRKLVNLFHC